MNAPGGNADLAFMNNQSRGKLVESRRLALGMSVRELAKEAGLSRNAIANAEAGGAEELTYARIESWLDNFEHEIGGDEVPVEPLVPFEIEMSGSFGIKVVFRGPPADKAEITAAARELIRDIIREERAAHVNEGDAG